MMRRTLAVLATLAVATLGAVACSGDDDDEPEAKASASSTTTTTTTVPPPPVAPLTGLPDATGALGRSALSVKIENSPAARPQTGLEHADVVYEEVVEGGITRFVAIYNSNVPEIVGPIRSVRDMDPNIVWPIGGVFAYSGGAPGPVSHITDAPVTLVDESATGTAMFRGGGKAAPHNLFGYTQALFDRYGVPIPPPPLFSYLEAGESLATAPVVAEPVASVRVGFQSGYDPTWTYDPTTGLWLRSYGFTPFMATSGEQIAPANVVVQFIDYPGYSDGKTVGGGDAWIFAGGQVVKGRWLRPAVEQPAVFMDAFGNPIKLVPGETWVELVPRDTAVDILGPPPPAPPAP